MFPLVNSTPATTGDNTKTTAGYVENIGCLVLLQ
jgi:hypothetical protein